jgi:ADP-heptose:LPS heptosyltransferase
MTRAFGLKDYTRNTALYLTREEQARAAAYARRHRSSGRLIVGMHPDGRRKNELWPAARFAELAERLIRERNATVFLFRGPGEEKVAAAVFKRIARKEHAHIVAELSLRNYAALANECDIFVAHDRGPMHIACALGVKTVAIFTTPCAQEWFPYRDKIGCDYVENKNAKSITVSEVLQKINGVLSATFSHDRAC